MLFHKKHKKHRRSLITSEDVKLSFADIFPRLTHFSLSITCGLLPETGLHVRKDTHSTKGIHHIPFLYGKLINNFLPRGVGTKDHRSINFCSSNRNTFVHREWVVFAPMLHYGWQIGEPHSNYCASCESNKLKTRSNKSNITNKHED